MLMKYIHATLITLGKCSTETNFTFQNAQLKSIDRQLSTHLKTLQNRNRYRYLKHMRLNYFLYIHE